MYRRVREYIRRYHMLDQGDRIIAGVSGGADSICLLFMLMKLKEEMDLSVVAVHVHHGLRGADADADADYVRKICEEWKTELRIFREDVRGFAVQRGFTLEEAGREVRREIFRKVQKEEEGTKIALAHHQNDNAETMIWNLCRGCGLRGLGGIAPAAGQWIRPLLCLKREEIESYLENRGISYCTDRSNLEDDYTRNRIRRHVIPYLEEHVNRQAVLHMSETMEQMRLFGEYIGQETRRYLESCTYSEGEGRVLLCREMFRKVPQALWTSVLHELLCDTAGRRKDLEAEHTRMLLELFDRQVGREIHLPYGICARRCYEGIELTVKEAQKPDPMALKRREEYVMFEEAEKMRDSGAAEKPETLEKAWGKTTPKGSVPGCPAAWRIFDRSGDKVIFPENPYTKWFDYDIIKNTVKIRHREPGDYITISKSGKTQKLKQYFVNEKIPQDQRAGIWLVAEGKHVMWIVGYRQNQKYQITDRTRRILEIEFYGGQDDGGKYKNIDSGEGRCKKD